MQCNNVTHIFYLIKIKIFIFRTYKHITEVTGGIPFRHTQDTPY